MLAYRQAKPIPMMPSTMPKYPAGKLSTCWGLLNLFIYFNF
ncbi:tellurite resistance TehA domain protein [Enterobacter roggenkampii]|nr:tellurite resistance TehA domain protein [Enterobacter roggenkampii]